MLKSFLGVGVSNEKEELFQFSFTIGHYTGDQSVEKIIAIHKVSKYIFLNSSVLEEHSLFFIQCFPLENI